MHHKICINLINTIKRAREKERDGEREIEREGGTVILPAVGG